MKHDWEWRSFEACLEKVIYTKKLQSSDYLSEGKYPIVSQEEGLISGYWDNDDDVFRITKPIVIFGDHTRVLKYIDFNFVLGADGVKILQPIDDIRAKFLYYYLKWFNVPSLGYSRHYKLLKECSVPVPALAVQERIVGELDKVREVIEKKKEQMKGLDSLAQSIFYDMFGDPVENEKGWEVKKLGEIGELSRGVSKHRPRNAPELLDGTMPLIQTGDVSNSGMYITEYHSTYSDLGVKQSRIWGKGTLCITIAANIGKCSILTFEACFPDSVVGFIPSKDTCTEYMYFVFGSIQKSLEDNAMGVAQKNINLGILNQISLALPPLSLQQAFAEKVETIEKQKELINQSIKEAQLLFDSRMEYWFGE